MSELKNNVIRDHHYRIKPLVKESSWKLRKWLMRPLSYERDEDGKPRHHLKWPYILKFKGLLKIGVCSLLLLAMYYYVTKSEDFKKQDLEMELLKRGIHDVDRILRWSPDVRTDHLPDAKSNRRIFFHETSGRGHLTFRQTCTVESAAQHNSDRPVQVYVTAKNIDFDTTPWLDILFKFPNIMVILMDDVDAYFAGTPLYPWYTEGLWRDTMYQIVHMSDYMRILNLMRAGGMYMDLDYMVHKPLDESLLWNFVPFETEDMKLLTNSVMHFERGHRMVRLFVDRLVYWYDPSEYFMHGPGMLSNVMARKCGLKRAMAESNNCTDVTILPWNYFAPVSNNAWKTFFREATEELMTKVLNTSYAVHLWHGKTKEHPLDIESNEIYSVLARDHCPLTVADAHKFPSI